MGNRSFRKEAHDSIRPLKPIRKVSCSEAFDSADNPIEMLQEFLKDPVLWEEALIGLRAVGAGSSPWARLFYLQTLCG
jgi:hypothetical protein